MKAKLKSVSLRNPYSSMTIFYYRIRKKGTGLRSRWMMPMRWICYKARMRLAR